MFKVENTGSDLKLPLTRFKVSSFEFQAPQVFNCNYRAEVSDHIMEDKLIPVEPSFSRPLEPKHVTEALRRINHRGLPVGRASKFIELIAL